MNNIITRDKKCAILSLFLMRKWGKYFILKFDKELLDF